MRFFSIANTVFHAAALLAVVSVSVDAQAAKINTRNYMPPHVAAKSMRLVAGHLNERQYRSHYTDGNAQGSQNSAGYGSQVIGQSQPDRNGRGAREVYVIGKDFVNITIGRPNRR